MPFLKEYRDWEFSNSWGPIDQILGAVNETDLVTHATVLGFYYIIHFYPWDIMELAI